jgi:predicted ATPase
MLCAEQQNLGLDPEIAMRTETGRRKSQRHPARTFTRRSRTISYYRTDQHSDIRRPAAGTHTHGTPALSAHRHDLPQPGLYPKPA